MWAGFQPRLGRRDATLYGIGARVPDFRLAPALAFAAEAVISTEAEQPGCIADLFSAQLCSHVGEIDVAGFLISNINRNITARLTRTIVIGNRPAAAGRRKAPAGIEMNVLHSIAKCGVHHYCLESRTRHVVFVRRAIQKWLFLAVVIQLDPGGLILDLLQTVRGVAVHGQHVAGLRIEHHHRAMVSLELIDDGLL